ncbi:uncharacterized protein LOC62_05G007597 [Vanrija pseudolonga]|uniref:F-box domain-containing protein n=1 Tax=Vanrija pseudolonga TaxID=143232 RepID=A0AAF1BPG6_9TREE|nr:hypothetical protein LOC62_05G007597 [Vanrija pseudolonga]
MVGVDPFDVLDGDCLTLLLGHLPVADLHAASLVSPAWRGFLLAEDSDRLWREAFLRSEADERDKGVARTKHTKKAVPAKAGAAPTTAVAPDPWYDTALSHVHTEHKWSSGAHTLLYVPGFRLPPNLPLSFLAPSADYTGLWCGLYAGLSRRLFHVDCKTLTVLSKVDAPHHRVEDGGALGPIVRRERVTRDSGNQETVCEDVWLDTDVAKKFGIPAAEGAPVCPMRGFRYFCQFDTRPLLCVTEVAGANSATTTASLTCVTAQDNIAEFTSFPSRSQNELALETFAGDVGPKRLVVCDGKWLVTSGPACTFEQTLAGYAIDGLHIYHRKGGYVASLSASTVGAVFDLGQELMPAPDLDTSYDEQRGGVQETGAHGQRVSLSGAHPHEAAFTSLLADLAFTGPASVRMSAAGLVATTTNHVVVIRNYAEVLSASRKLSPAAREAHIARHTLAIRLDDPNKADVLVHGPRIGLVLPNHIVVVDVRASSVQPHRLHALVLARQPCPEGFKPTSTSCWMDGAAVYEALTREGGTSTDADDATDDDEWIRPRTSIRWVARTRRIMYPKNMFRVFSFGQEAEQQGEATKQA